MLDYVQDDKYLRAKYQKVYLPTMISVHITELEHYIFIKTVDCGSKKGHIIHGKDGYYLCLREDDYIRFDQAIYQPMGFCRSTIDQCEKLASEYLSAHKNNLNGLGEVPVRVLTKNLKKAIIVPQYDLSINWFARMKGHYIVHIPSKREVHLGQPKIEVIRLTGLSYTSLDSVVYKGYIAKDWAYKGERIDGKSWEEVFTSCSVS